MIKASHGILVLGILGLVVGFACSNTMFGSIMGLLGISLAVGAYVDLTS